MLSMLIEVGNRKMNILCCCGESLRTLQLYLSHPKKRSTNSSSTLVFILGSSGFLLSSDSFSGDFPDTSILIIIFYCRLMVHITDTRAKKSG